MSPFTYIAAGLLLCALQASGLGVVSLVTGGITAIGNEVTEVKNVVEKGVVTVGSSQCNIVKSIIELQYKDYKNKEPDYSELTLNYITSDMHLKYKLDNAAKHITQSNTFNLKEKFTFYLHGFTDNPSKVGFTTIGKTLLSAGYSNVLALDASSLIGFLYLRSTTMVRLIGEQLGKVLVGFYEAGVEPSKIHLIGHSLGSHIASFAGKSFYNQTGEHVGRISGLDPAGPCFVGEDLKLTKTDADFVDVIHTDSGVFGLTEPVGHIDFYPNNGESQPGCFLQTCSHSRAWELFAESVTTPEAFPAVLCADWNSFKNGQCDSNTTSFLGFGCQSRVEGTYYLTTSDANPYGQGVKGLSTNAHGTIVGKLTDGIEGLFG